MALKSEAAGPARADERSEVETRAVPFAEALRFWVKLGFISFGGPAGQIAIMHRELVERRRRLGEERFLHALNYSMPLPGPEAQQLAVYIGWLMHRTWGGIVAGALFVLPSVFTLLALSYIYAAYGNLPAVADVLWVVLAGGVLGLAWTLAGAGEVAVKQEKTIVFVCEHGSAKSDVAAAHFNRLAGERGSGLQAVSRGTDPDAEIAPAAEAGLRADGLAASEQSPAKLTQADAAGAALVVTFCELPGSYATATPVEQWDGVPPVSEDYAKARDEIVGRIGRLLDGLEARN